MKPGFSYSMLWNDSCQGDGRALIIVYSTALSKISDILEEKMPVLIYQGKILRDILKYTLQFPKIWVGSWKWKTKNKTKQNKTKKGKKEKKEWPFSMYHPYLL